MTSFQNVLSSGTKVCITSVGPERHLLPLHFPKTQVTAFWNIFYLLFIFIWIYFISYVLVHSPSVCFNQSWADPKQGQTQSLPRWDRGPRIWIMLCCFPGHISREINPKWSNRAWNWGPCEMTVPHTEEDPTSHQATLAPSHSKQLFKEQNSVHKQYKHIKYALYSQ